ncbi:FAD-dependent oxidoreductase [Pedobacter sp. MW01-1-1]|uniref:FAD-dependent oxidoreductase n=1 Tax=Pedobacter sp. MW01-1-1 TaxID=3383027 RepID=UPI003FEEDD44
MSNQHYNAVIIGGGLGGLTAGATLAKHGKKVLLLEQHYIPGGCASSFKRKDFVMEVGLHEMDGLHEEDAKVKIFKFLGVDKHLEFLKVPELFHLKSPKTSFTFPHGVEEAKASLIQKFPNEAVGLQLFFNTITAVLSELPKLPGGKWKSKLMYPLMPILFPNVVKASRQTVGEWLDKHLKNEELKLILTTNLLYYGDDTSKLSMLYFSAAQASYITGGGHFIKGGSQQLSNYLAAVIEKNGGQVLLGKKVNHILVENGTATGVMYQDAYNSHSETKKVTADTVIGNAAVPLLADLLPEKYKNAVRRHFENKEVSCSLISIYLGFNKPLKELGVKNYSTFIAGADIHSIKDLKDNYQGNWENRNFVLVDYSQIDSNLAPQGKSIATITAADYLVDWENLTEVAYKLKKEEVAQIFLKRLEAAFPGICPHLEYYEVGSAKTIQNYTKNPSGTPYGFAQTPEQSGFKRLTRFPEIKNLHFASAWGFPGGGFSGAIIGGYMTASQLVKNTKWKVLNHGNPSDERTVKLIAKKIVAKNTMLLRFERPKDFHYKAGQYAVVRLNNPAHTDLDMPFRALSMASHPSSRTLDFVMRLSKSSFKKSCIEMNISDTATIYGPMGNFSIQNPNKPIVFLASGIGITPIIPLLMELEKSNHEGKISLLYSNKCAQHAAYHPELGGLELSNFSYHLVETGKESRIDKTYVKSKVQDIQNSDYYLVGTREFIRSMKSILISLQVKEESIYVDDFG